MSRSAEEEELGGTYSKRLSDQNGILSQRFQKELIDSEIDLT